MSTRTHCDGPECDAVITDPAHPTSQAEGAGRADFCGYACLAAWAQAFVPAEEPDG